MNSILVPVKLFNTIKALVSSENMVFLAKIGLQTGNGYLAVIDY